MTVMEPLRLDGITALRKQLKAAGEGAEKQIRPALNDAADVIVRVARPKIPSVTGAARASLRVASVGVKVRVQAGGTKAPYYPWLDYGGRVGRNKSIVRPFYGGGRYLWPAYDQERVNIMRLLDKRLADVIEANGLKVDEGNG